MKGPNDQNPPWYVTGEHPMENLFEDVYERFPWVEDIDNMLSDNTSTWSTPEGKPNETVGTVLEFVADRAYTLGTKEASEGMGEYTEYMREELLGCIHMVLDAAAGEPGWSPSPKEVYEAIDWDLLATVEQSFLPQPKGKRLVEVFAEAESPLNRSQQHELFVKTLTDKEDDATGN